MLGAIYVGLSGLNAYQQGLQQVSGNVSNLNSTGFKASTVNFTTLLGGRDSGGLAFASGSESRGQGVSIAEPRLDFRPGELRTSERDLDLAVEGTGFLVLLRDNETRYTRTGSFEVNKDGFIVLQGTEYRLATLDDAGKPVSLSIDAKRTSPPKATTSIKFADNLSSTATRFGVADVKVFDATGKQSTWQIEFTRKTDTQGNEWTVKVTNETGTVLGEKTMRFINGAIDPETAKLGIPIVPQGPEVILDFSSNVTSFSSGEVSTLRSAAVDGYAAGAITTIVVTDKGKLEISYSNEQKEDLGAVAVADFRDPQSLEQLSGGLFRQKDNSARLLLASEDPRVGQVRGRRQEASNVDLSRQFGDLILIQRGYQASSQIISVSNDMIQQLFGIRGQG